MASVDAACPGCGFPLLAGAHAGTAAGSPLAWSYDESRSAGAGPRIRGLAGEVAAHLRGTDPDQLRRRPAPGVWSPLEYACHVRDVLLVQRERVLLVRRGYGGEAEPMGRDERVEHDGYNEQRPADVAVQVEHAALLLAGVLARLGASDWDRTIGYGFPAPARRSLRWVAVHTEHEVAHHLADMRAQVAASPP